jgi:FdhD/NarQ family
VRAGIPVLTAVSAPPYLAVDLASQSGLTLVAFLRGDSKMSAVSGPHHALNAGTKFAPQSVNRLRMTDRIRCTASFQRALGSPSSTV